MNFINKALFTAELYKNKRECDLFALDTILREPTNVEPRDLKEDGPITIIADNYNDSPEIDAFWSKRVHAYLRDESKKGLCNVTSIFSEGPYASMEGKSVTYFIAIPVQRMVTSLDTTGVDIMKATVICSKDKTFIWSNETKDVAEDKATYNKILVLIANVNTESEDHQITISESTIGKQLAQKILDNPEGKTSFHQRTIHIQLTPAESATALKVRYEGCNDTTLYPTDYPYEKKTIANKVLKRVASNIIRNARVSDIVRSK